MTSSFIAHRLAGLSKTDSGIGPYSFSLPDSTLGGMEDRYISLQKPCHPDFDTTPIGHPEGVKMCTRKLDSCGNRIGTTMQQRAAFQGAKDNGVLLGDLLICTM